MESTYTTKQGDVWDKIAYEVYGDEEYTGWLMENNFPLMYTSLDNTVAGLETQAARKESTATSMSRWKT